MLGAVYLRFTAVTATEVAVTVNLPSAQKCAEKRTTSITTT